MIDVSTLTGPQCSKRYFETHYPEILQHLRNDLPFGEALYLYINKLNNPPHCRCGATVKFINIKTGYRQYCSRRCMNSDPDKKSRTISTCQVRYGGPSPASSKTIREKMELANLSKYGFKNAMQNVGIKCRSISTTKQKYSGIGNQSIELRARRHNTMIKRYGGEFNNREKSQSTCRERYGVDHPSQLKSVRSKISSARRAYEMERGFILGYTDQNEWICRCPHPECNLCLEKTYIIPPVRHSGRLYTHTELCTRLLPIARDTTSNTWPERFIKTILDECGIMYECNVPVLNDKHIDIYCPELKIGFECNGVYWHSDKYKTSSYHREKTTIALKNGIRLYHIWEDWIINSPEIIKSMVRNWVNYSKRKIYARKCTVKQITSSQSNDFISMNHIQGKAGSTIAYGLYYKGELVSVMTFGHHRGCIGSKCESWELLRFCSALNTNVIGGASRLLAHFVKDCHPQSVYSFASRDISAGELYSKLGFAQSSAVTQSYWYIDPKTMKRYHRTSFTKDRIIKLGWKNNKNGWTEREVMDEHGYLRIHDAGQTKWIYTP